MKYLCAIIIVLLLSTQAGAGTNFPIPDYAGPNAGLLFRNQLNNALSELETDANGKQPSITSTGILKGNGSGSVTSATPGVDYVSPTGFHNYSANQAPIISGAVQKSGDTWSGDMNANGHKIYGWPGYSNMSSTVFGSALPSYNHIYYIAPSGSDTTGDGSISSPWLTMTKGMAALVGGDCLYARGGTYTQSGAGTAGWLSGTAGNSMTIASGTSGNPITIKAYPGETPVFDGVDNSCYGVVISNNSYLIFDGLSFTRYKAPVYLYHGNSHITFQNDHLYANGSDVNQHQGIYIASDDVAGHGNSNITVRNNLIETSADAGIQCWHLNSVNGLFVYNNVFKGNKVGVLAGDGAANLYIYNNTFDGQTWGAFDFGQSDNTYYCTNVILKNNIISGSTTAGLRVATSNASQVVSDYNDYYGNGTDIIWNWNGTTGTNYSLSSFKSAAPEISGNEASSISSNPLYTGSGDYHISSNSPCVDTGTTLTAVPYDFSYITRPQGPAYDIGAYEYAMSPTYYVSSSTTVNSQPLSSNVTVTDANLSTSDITTNNVSTSKHGFAPKLPNDATVFLNGVGAYTTPAANAGNLIGIQYLTSGTTYTPTSGTHTIIIEMVGGGGGGGGAFAASGNSSAGSGGCAGGYLRKRITGFSGTASYSIGARGTGGSSSGGKGVNGGATTFVYGGVTYTAGGGPGGYGMTAGTSMLFSPASAPLSYGGTASNGDVNIYGYPGGSGIRLSGTQACGGAGGMSAFGSTAYNGGGASPGYGGGGQGGTGLNLSTSGQDGGAGIIIVYEYN